MRFLVFYIPYGTTGPIVCAEMAVKAISSVYGHLYTNRKLPFARDFLSLGEWMTGSAVGEYCQIPNGFYQHVVRIK